jgi:hypothetical protein
MCQENSREQPLLDVRQTVRRPFASHQSHQEGDKPKERRNIEEKKKGLTEMPSLLVSV